MPMSFTVRLDSPAGRLLLQLRHGPKTIEELAKVIRLTDNAVRNQIKKLEAANLINRSGARPGVSKPAVLYAITLEGQIQFSTIYLPVLSQFFRSAETKCSTTEFETFMKDTGKSLANRYPKPVGGITRRVHSAARLLKSFGGLPVVKRKNGSLVIQSVGCPLAVLTSENSAACKVIESLLAEYVSASVKTCCDMRDEPRCCFEIKGAD